MILYARRHKQCSIISNENVLTKKQIQKSKRRAIIIILSIENVFGWVYVCVCVCLGMGSMRIDWLGACYSVRNVFGMGP